MNYSTTKLDYLIREKNSLELGLSKKREEVNSEHGRIQQIILGKNKPLNIQDYALFHFVEEYENVETMLNKLEEELRKNKWVLINERHIPHSVWGCELHSGIGITTKPFLKIEKDENSVKLMMYFSERYNELRFTNSRLLNPNTRLKVLNTPNLDSLELFTHLFSNLEYKNGIYKTIDDRTKEYPIIQITTGKRKTLELLEKITKKNHLLQVESPLDLKELLK